MFRLIVYSRQGTPLAEIHDAISVKWSYALNKNGQLVFDIGLSHPKATPEVLQKHNTVILEHDSLERWCGYIANPLWPSSGDLLTITCNSIEQRLGQRRSEVLSMKDAKPSDIFSSILAQANRREPTGLHVGLLDTGGNPYTLEFHRENLYDKMQDLLENSKGVMRVNYVNPVTWVADFSHTKGRDLTDKVALTISSDAAEAPEYGEEMTEFANSVTAVGKMPEGKSVPEGQDDYGYRPYAEYTDYDSVRVYGLVEDTVEFSDLDDANALLQKAKGEVERRSVPKTTLQFSINRVRELWGKFTDGDIICAELPRYGFTGLAVPVRVLGREVDDSASRMTLALETITGADAKTLAMYRNVKYGSGPTGVLPSSNYSG